MTYDSWYAIKPKQTKSYIFDIYVYVRLLIALRVLCNPVLSVS